MLGLYRETRRPLQSSGYSELQVPRNPRQAERLRRRWIWSRRGYRILVPRLVLNVRRILPVWKRDKRGSLLRRAFLLVVRRFLAWLRPICLSSPPSTRHRSPCLGSILLS